MSDGLADFALRAFIAATMLPLFAYQIFGTDTPTLFKALCGDTHAKRYLREKNEGGRRAIDTQAYFDRARSICLWSAVIQLPCLFIWPFTMIGHYPLGLCIVFSLLGISVAFYVSLRQLSLTPLRNAWASLVAFTLSTGYIAFAAFR